METIHFQAAFTEVTGILAKIGLGGLLDVDK